VNNPPQNGNGGGQRPPNGGPLPPHRATQPLQQRPPGQQPLPSAPGVRPQFPELPPNPMRGAGGAPPQPPRSPAPPQGGHAAPPGSNGAPPRKRETRPAEQKERLRMPPEPRSRRTRHPLVVIGNAIFTLLVMIAVAGGVGLYIGKQRFEQPGPLEQEKIVNVPKGLGVRDVGEMLAREGIIDQPLVFAGAAKMFESRGGIKYGEYRIKAHASIADIIDEMIEGRVVQHQFTVAEGLTSSQIVDKLMQTDALTGEIREVPREGTLLPDSYRFTRGMTRQQIIERMQHAQQRVLKEVWDHRSPELPIKSPEQLVTLASIVEKETGKPDERTRVAAVFVNRLKNRMRLQSDPTIIYGLTGGKGSLGRPIMRSEIEQHTPYNTYVIDGLPPGPIANPGRASLEAAANPARTKELYFVADGTGGHVFSEKYEDHQKNVAKLRASERDDPATTTTTTAPAAATTTPKQTGTSGTKR
jgi:UPF0755 protein